MKRVHPIFNLTKKPQNSESPSGSQEPDHRKKNSGKYPSDLSYLSPSGSSPSCVPPVKELSPGDGHPISDHSRRLNTIVPMETEDDEEDTFHFDTLNARSDIPTTCVLVDEINNQPGSSRRRCTIPDPSKLTFPKLPERFTLEQTSSISSNEELYVNPGTRFIKKFQKGVSEVKNSHIFNWIKKSKKPDWQEPSDSKEKKSKEDYSRSPSAVSDAVNCCVSAGEFESEDANSVQFFHQQAKNEFIAIQMEEDESKTDESGKKNRKWAVNSNLGNEVDYDSPGPSRVNKRRKSNGEQQEIPVDDGKKEDCNSDDSSETFENGSFEKVKKNPLLNWIKRHKIAKSSAKSNTFNQSNGSLNLNEASEDFSNCPAKESGIANSQHSVLSISSSSKIHCLVRRLKRKRKIEIEHDTTHPQPNDVTPLTPEHPVPSQYDANEDNNAPGPANHQPTDQTEVTIEIDSDDDNDESCCMQGLQRCVCGAKEKACVMCSFMERQKRKWDEWNPDLNNPFFMCLAESKLAGLKEAVKPNRGIYFRYCAIYYLFN